MLGSFQYNHNPIPPVIVFLGDSITANPPQWPDSMFAQVGSVGGPFSNVAHDGWTTLDVLADMTTSVLPHAPITTGVPAMAHTLAGSNDLLTRSAADTYASLKQIWAQLRAWGFTTAVGDLIANNNAPQGSDWDNKRLVLNPLIQSDSTLFDLFIDYAAAFPYIFITMFTQDGTHPNQAGADRLASVCWKSILSGGFVPLM